MNLLTRKMYCKSGTDSMPKYIFIYHLAFEEIHMIEGKMVVNS